MIGLFVCMFVCLLVGWLVSWLVGLLIDWLNDWLIHVITQYLIDLSRNFRHHTYNINYDKCFFMIVFQVGGIYPLHREGWVRCLQVIESDGVGVKGTLPPIERWQCENMYLYIIFIHYNDIIIMTGLNAKTNEPISTNLRQFVIELLINNEK